ncbi:hypothetical protein C1H46_030153 [Malus baccata]|uniref:No apical meristem-associated C-terminal domain-containing protein n=1 Tax=Malus baccata TaxID=106549 RepID=A0A540LCS8_MALBA|nr:hypothetical protein C1H46_030153 [Malus baccata]
MATFAMKGRIWTRKEDEVLCRTYRWVSEDSVRVRQVKEFYMEDNSKPFSHHGCWEICKGWVLFEDPPQQRVGPTLVFGNASSTADGDKDGSPTIQETMVENPSPGEDSIPRAMGRNNARKLKAKDDYALQQEIATSLRLMVEQNAIAVEEMNRRQEEWAKQIQEEMDDRNCKGTLQITLQ